MDELIAYIHSNKVTKNRIRAEVKDANFNAYPKRNIFVKLRQYANSFLTDKTEPRFIALAGLRGVGKTTLLWQTAEEIFKKTSKIYFLNGNDLKSLDYSLNEVFITFEQKILKKPFYELSDTIVFLVDEIHDLEKWDIHLKMLYDKTKQVFVLCTGSSALLLHKNADLASRITIEKVFPFKFTEFILASSWTKDRKDLIFPKKNLGVKFKEVLFFSKNLKELEKGLVELTPIISAYLSESSKRLNPSKKKSLIDEYVSYHNIARFLTIQNKEIINERVISLFERILYKDLPVIEENTNAETLFRLLMRLALSDEVNFQTLARDFGKQEAVEHFIDLLDKAEILNVFMPEGGIKTKTGKNVKPFFMSPSLRRALYTRIYGDKLSDELRGKLYEDIIAMYLRRLFDRGLLSFGHSNKNSSPDFIVKTMDEPVLLEVGVNKRNSKQIKGDHRRKRYGIIVNAKIAVPEFKDDHVFIPLAWFLLL